MLAKQCPSIQRFARLFWTSTLTILLTLGALTPAEAAMPQNSIRDRLKQRIYHRMMVKAEEHTYTDYQKMGFAEHRLRVGDVTRVFLVKQPPSSGSAKRPLVLLLHGGIQSMRKVFEGQAGGAKAWPALAELEGFVLLVPNAGNPETGDPTSNFQAWNDLRNTGEWYQHPLDDVAFIRALVAWSHVTLGTDPNRTYVTGASNGGMMTQRLLIEAPELFAAGAAFISALPSETAILPSAKQPTPLLLANGTADPMVLWQGGPISQFRRETRSVQATVQWWVNANNANAIPTAPVSLPDRDPADGCSLSQVDYVPQPEGAVMRFITMLGSGHAMPSIAYPIPTTGKIKKLIGTACKDVEGAELAWDFLKQFRR